MFTSPSQILFSIGDFHIYYYGVIMAISIAIGILVSDYIGARFFDFKKETIIDMAPYIIIFGIIFARLYYCFLDVDFYLRFPTEILAVRHGGISIHGAILGGIVAILIFSKRHNLNYKKLLDVSAIGLSLGQAIGRWGNFFNSEAYGFPTNLPWKLYIAPQYRHIPYLDYEYYHPAFLYESILDLFIFGILLYFVHKRFFKKDGIIALLYLILYSFVRIFVELFRIDSAAYLFGCPVAIIVSVCIMLVSFVLLYRVCKDWVWKY